MKENLRRFRELAGYKPAEVARAVGVERGSVYHWEDTTSKSMPKIHNLIRLSELYGKSVSEILGQTVAPAGQGLVRVVQLKTLEITNYLDDLRIPSTEASYVSCPFPHGPDTYALEISSPANQCASSDSLPIGTLVYLDPGIEPESGQMIAARMQSGEAVVRMYVSEAGERFLRALNPEYRRVDDPFEILAVVIGSTKTAPGV